MIKVIEQNIQIHKTYTNNPKKARQTDEGLFQK